MSSRGMARAPPTASTCAATRARTPPGCGRWFWRKRRDLRSVQAGAEGPAVPALWLVPREAIDEVGDFVDELGRTYHRVDGYSLKAKLKEARERAATRAG